MLAWLNLNLHNIVTDKINQNYKRFVDNFPGGHIVRSHVNRQGLAAVVIMPDFKFRSKPKGSRNRFKRSTSSR